MLPGKHDWPYSYLLFCNVKLDLATISVFTWFHCHIFYANFIHMSAFSLFVFLHWAFCLLMLFNSLVVAKTKLQWTLEVWIITGLTIQFSYDYHVTDSIQFDFSMHPDATHQFLYITSYYVLTYKSKQWKGNSTWDTLTRTHAHLISCRDFFHLTTIDDAFNEGLFTV